MPAKKKARDVSKKSFPKSYYDTGEADHQFFLQAFEKPTQIYRYLRNRHAVCPLFLHRTLYFMKHRCRRSKAVLDKRRNFEIDNMLSVIEKRTNNAYKEESLNLDFTSFHHRDACGTVSDSRQEVDVEVFLLKICLKKRKDVASPVVRTSVGRVTIPINCDSLRDNNSITISHNEFSPKSGHSVHSYRLLVQVTCPVRTPLLNGLCAEDPHESGEPAQKRRRSSRGLPVPQDTNPSNKVIYSAELSVYDRQRCCDLTAGQYEIALHDPNRSANKSSAQWYSNIEIKDEESILEAFYSGPRLKFDLSWVADGGDSGESDTPRATLQPLVMPPKSMNCIMSPRDLSDHAMTGERPSDNLRSSPPRHLRVIYQFLYKNNTRQQTEARTDTTCPWCSVRCGRLYALLKHLRLSHARFHFVYLPHAKGAKINVSLNDRYDGSYVGNPQDLHSHIGYAFSRSGPVRRTPVTHVIVYRPRRSGAALSEFMEGGHETSVTREIVQGHNRLYYDSETNQPIKPQHLDIDSEAGNDPQWLQIKTVKMIDEFTDVNEGEKAIMKMWNLHIMKHNFVGDCQVPLACSTFVDSYGPCIVEKKLVRNFVLHLVNLFDFSLIRPEIVQKSMTQLQQYIDSRNDSAAAAEHQL